VSFKLVILRPDNDSYVETWPEKLDGVVPGIIIYFCNNLSEAMNVIEDADAAFGDISAELFARANNLKWIQCFQAGPKAGYYHRALIESDVLVTNTRGIFNDHISMHIMSYVLAFARGLNVYISRQIKHYWNPGYETIHLPNSTAIIVGAGGIGAETARLCSAFGMRVIAVDPRVSERPIGVDELYGTDYLDELLPKGDFVIVCAPETPTTQGLFNDYRFRLMKRSAFFINVGRGSMVILDDLTKALNEGEIQGAALDVFEKEPLTDNHPLWTTPGVIITPHVAGIGPYLLDRRVELYLDNCVRFSQNKPLRNVVDKKLWF
jgi:phosphoglycerate dehydrogenase-like enzyme